MIREWSISGSQESPGRRGTYSSLERLDAISIMSVLVARKRNQLMHSLLALDREWSQNNPNVAIRGKGQQAVKELSRVEE